MIEAHQAEMAQRDERFSALESENAALKAQLVEMTVGASFLAPISCVKSSDDSG